MKTASLKCLTFFLAASIELIIVLDFYAVMRQQPLASAIYTGLISFAGAVIVKLYVKDKSMIVLDILGSMLGAYIAVKWFY